MIYSFFINELLKTESMTTVKNDHSLKIVHINSAMNQKFEISFHSELPICHHVPLIFGVISWDIRFFFWQKMCFKIPHTSINLPKSIVKSDLSFVFVLTRMIHYRKILMDLSRTFSFHSLFLEVNSFCIWNEKFLFEYSISG